MGEVWLVEETATGRLLAAKRLKLKHKADNRRDDGGEAEAARLRFKREFVAIAKLDDPGVIKAHQLYETPDNIAYTMDYVEGWPLGEYLAHGHWRPGGATEIPTLDYYRSEAGQA